jgi:pyroglutamyl-peptidase
MAGMTSQRVLVTGFEAFGGLVYNPSAEVAQALDKAEIAGHAVVGRILPVDFARHCSAVAELLSEVEPVLYIAFGLYGGEDMIRIERFGVNLADFEIPDNAGLRHSGHKIEPEGPDARSSTFPAAEIRAAMIAVGIPARLSNTAGSYLCNATLYSSLRLCAESPQPPLCGFIHLPYATHQVATQLQDTGGKPPSLAQDATAPSLAIGTMIEAGRISIAVSLQALSASKALPPSSR